MNLEEALERIAHLEDTVNQLLEEKADLARRLLNAKDPTSIKRVSFERVKKLAESSFLTLKKICKRKEYSLSDGSTFSGPARCVGYELSMAHLKRTFKKLKDLWDFLCQDSWSLHDLLPLEEPKKEKKPKGQSICKYCQNPIQWIQDVFAGRWFPYEENGNRHQCHTSAALSGQRTLVPF